MPAIAAACRPSISRPANLISRKANHHAINMAAPPIAIHAEPMSMDNPLSASAVKLPTNAAWPVAKPM